MRFHWFYRTNISVPELISLSSDLEDAGYYSVLLTYHSKTHDMLLPSFGAASNSQKLKYMIAMRTYAISPEYMAMICKIYNEVFPDKLIINVCSGDLQQGESSLEDIVFIRDLIDNNEKRREYTKQWLNNFKKLAIKNYFPELIMGGHSDRTKELCKEFNAINLSAGTLYKEYYVRENKIISDKQMVEFSVVIRDSDEEALSFVSDHGVDGHKKGDDLRWTIYGTKETVKAEIKKYYDLGVTDILISYLSGDNNISGIHQMVKELILEEKA